MNANTILTNCPVCGEDTWAATEKGYRCPHCQLVIEEKRPLLPFGSKPEKYVIRNIGDEYKIAREGILDQAYLLDELPLLKERVYDDQTLADFAAGEIEKMNMPSSTLAQILLEQLREVCFLQINTMRRGFGPALGEQSCRFPQGNAPSREMDWQDEGNLFLTNIRLVFPSNSFTFIRMDRKMTSVWTFRDGLAVQRKGETHATYFVGCRANQAALASAYILGKVPPLRKNVLEAVPSL